MTSEIPSVYSERVYVNSANLPFVNMIPGTAVRVLDIGCGVGANMALLMQRGHECIGVTASDAENNVVQANGMKSVVADCTQQLPFLPGSFDAIILCHILEHLPWPEKVLEVVTPLLAAGGRIYCAVPNIAFFRHRLRILKGDFPQETCGVFDETHLRWFTWSSPRNLAKVSGMDLEVLDGDAWFRKVFWLPLIVERMLVRVAPNLFSQQIRFVLAPSSKLSHVQSDVNVMGN